MRQMGVWRSSLRMQAPWIALSDEGFMIIDDQLPPGSEWGLVAELTKVPEECNSSFVIIQWRTKMPSLTLLPADCVD